MSRFRSYFRVIQVRSDRRIMFDGRYGSSSRRVWALCVPPNLTVEVHPHQESAGVVPVASQVLLS